LPTTVPPLRDVVGCPVDVVAGAADPLATAEPREEAVVALPPPL
jgi:hypothetical protein